MSACFDSSTNTSRGFVFDGSLPICETNPVFDILKWRRRLLTSLRALSAESGVHSVHIEVGGDLNSVENKRPRLGDGLLHRQHANDVIADAQMIALGLDVGVHNLVVEKLRGCGLPAMRQSS